MAEPKQSSTKSTYTFSKRRTTCGNCRRRKSKCDGLQPQCSTCIAHNSQCQYDKPPSLAYVKSLETKIEALLRERDATFPFSPSAVPLGSSLQSHTSELSTGQWKSEFSVDSDGNVCYHNPTSAIHEPIPEGPQLSSRSSTSAGIVGTTSEVNIQQLNTAKESLVLNAKAQRRFEALALENMDSDQHEVSSDMASEFLSFFWCWVHPMFMFVYRPAFARDMALSSSAHPERPYFSETLLKVIFAHSARFSLKNALSQDQASIVLETLTQQAYFALAKNLSMPSSITTIQALLQQSARETAFGNSSQAWLYSGMAFRIAVDLGIHLPSDTLRGYARTLNAEDIEIRKRLYWSCYAWDKVISIYMGRMPAFTPLKHPGQPVFLDDFSENDLWVPFYGSTDQQYGNARVPYPPQRGHMVSCFTALCGLSTALSSIMFDIYGQQDTHTSAQENNSAKRDSFAKISMELQNWWVELPEVVRLDVNSLPILCPPLHIVSLNLLYHTTLILLNRPFILGIKDFQNYATARSYQICITAAAAIHDLLTLLTATFGHSHVSYLNGYTLYIAATVAVLHFQNQEEGNKTPSSDVPPEKVELKFFLDIMQKTAIGMPALDRSLEIIKRSLEAIMDKRSKRYMDSLFPPDTGQQASNAGNMSTFPAVIKFQSLDQGRPSKSHLQSISPSLEAEGSFHTYSTYTSEGLPAFPGQNPGVGLSDSSNSVHLNPDLRATALGLDPHVTLYHDDLKWAYRGY